MAKKWTDEEIQFLKFAYTNKDFTSRDISKVLGRSVISLHAKACKLNIKRCKNEVLEGNLKRCTKCKTLLDVSMFYTNGSGRIHSWCKECKKDNYKERTVPKRCPKCKEIKPVSEFNKNRTKKDGLNAYCRLCQSKASEESKLKKLKERGL